MNVKVKIGCADPKLCTGCDWWKGYNTGWHCDLFSRDLTRGGELSADRPAPERCKECLANELT